MIKCVLHGLYSALRFSEKVEYSLRGVEKGRNGFGEDSGNAPVNDAFKRGWHA